MNQSGITKRIIPITTYTCGNLAASDSSQIIIGQHVDATTFTEADLVIRFHQGTTIATGTFSLGFAADGWTFDDPASAFLASLSRTVLITSATTFPFYSVLPVPPPWGGLAAIVLVAAQGLAAGTLTAVLSVDLVLKGGDVRGLPIGPNGYRGYRDM